MCVDVFTIETGNKGREYFSLFRACSFSPIAFSLHTSLQNQIKATSFATKSFLEKDVK